MSTEILYEDNHLLVVAKPPDIPVQADISGALDLLTILKEEMKVKYNKPGNVFLGLVHRLDRPAGGVMVFAKTSKAASRLSSQIREHQLEKTYLCVVKGSPQPAKGRLTDCLLKDPQTNIVQVVPPNTPKGKEAVLDYEVLGQSGEYNLVKVHLLTGRSHQIRVQMSHNGTPLFGDAKYGYKGKKDDRLALWSCSLAFMHPTKKERMQFTSSPPEEYPWNLFKV